ncbi:hypothetical protein WICPIJ_007718 [Wickerhamomyces pijperi]|uniref:Uncharacterized protein n=1 Tax=Wickerhamomyces pijperi TaxID=599730 RepID=A0A9P8TJN2_WICPI|nr:hypothetical protein WICPIJ_007718 [Wickerhamomyces pijperi]
MSAILDKWEFHSLRSLLFLHFKSPPQLKVTGLESLEIISKTELNLSQIQKMYPDQVSLIIDAPHFCKDPNQRSIEFHKLQYLSITRTLSFSSCELKEQDQDRKAQLFAAVNCLNLPSLLILDFKFQDGTYETNMDLHFPAPQLQFIKLRIMEPTFKGDDSEIHEDGYDSDIEQDSMVRGDAHKFKFQYHISDFPQLKHLLIPSLFNTIRIKNCRNLETIQAYNPTYNSKLYADSVPNLSLLNICALSQKQQKSVIRFPISNNHRLLTLDKTTTFEDLRNNRYAQSNISAYNEDYRHSQGERKKLYVHQYKLVSQECSYSSILQRYENSLLGEYREKMKQGPTVTEEYGVLKAV